MPLGRGAPGIVGRLWSSNAAIIDQVSFQYWASDFYGSNDMGRRGCELCCKQPHTSIAQRLPLSHRLSIMYMPLDLFSFFNHSLRAPFLDDLAHHHEPPQRYPSMKTVRTALLIMGLAFLQEATAAPRAPSTTQIVLPFQHAAG